MAFKIILLISILISVILAENTTESDRFVGGRVTVSGEFPSVVSILTPATPLSHCNGVILNENHILTAARCVYNASNHLLHPFWLQLIAGDLNIMVPSFRRFTTGIVRIYPHPQYNPQTNNNDIAILRVRDRFPLPHNTIDTATRNERVLPIGVQCQSAGWGANGNNQPLGQTQQTVTLPLLDRTICNAANVHAGRVQENMICAGSMQPNQNALCQGSIGSGLFCNNELTGVLSFGLGCGAANNAAVFTQIRFFENWIRQQFTRNDTIAPGTPAANAA